MSLQKIAVIVFVRNPQLGKVKTRLANGIGAAAALEAYIHLLQQTKKCIEYLVCDKYIFYTDVTNENDIWENNLFFKEKQSGDTLGERMSIAFNYLFKKGYKNVLIIGSDCPTLTKDIIENAIHKLANTDTVIGPTVDGGYYLLGLNTFLPNIFKNIEWSTNMVFNETVKTLKQLHKTTFLLPTLSDIDTLEDWLAYQNSK